MSSASCRSSTLSFTEGDNGRLIRDRLRGLGYSLQANAKTREGVSHPDRDAGYLKTLVRRWARIYEPLSPMSAGSASSPSGDALSL
jgi:hypothetical protein